MAAGNHMIPFAIGALVGAAAAAILVSDKTSELKDKLSDVAIAGLDALEKALAEGGQK